MLKFNVQPLVEVNGVKFGMSRADVRKQFGEAVEFKKNKFSKTITDDFAFCHVYYDTDDKCEAIEIFKEAEVTVNGKVIFPGTISDAQKFIKDLEEEKGSYISKSQSIGIYAPEGEIECILFGNRGYYE